MSHGAHMNWTCHTDFKVATVGVGDEAMLPLALLTGEIFVDASRRLITQVGALQHTATHCSTLQRMLPLAHLNGGILGDAFRRLTTQVCWWRFSKVTLQHSNTLQHSTATHWRISWRRFSSHPATHWRDLCRCFLPSYDADVRPAAHCNTLQRTATHRNTVQHTGEIFVDACRLRVTQVCALQHDTI